MLRYSPKLQSLTLKECHLVEACDPRPCWSEPNSVPECLLLSLEALEWVDYEGTEEAKEVVAFILRSARCLEKVTICSSSTDPCKLVQDLLLFLYFFCILFLILFFIFNIHSFHLLFFP
ncbi:hypothetical protein Bca52824_094876 [Brassica carinata]|uniref:FBD domain-containing protein n=1 Tax=Brassica carinata TaxID=52824 RepID=A0A8X7P1C0_BRACI|nr:hypothetical protein Bca52824_094876 [Brassica carinata]